MARGRPSPIEKHDIVVNGEKITVSLLPGDYPRIQISTPSGWVLEGIAKTAARTRFDVVSGKKTDKPASASQPAETKKKKAAPRKTAAKKASASASVPAPVRPSLPKAATTRKTVGRKKPTVLDSGSKTHASVVELPRKPRQKVKRGVM